MADPLPDNPSLEEFLAHYGVLGMHWGTRKAETRSERSNRNASQKQFRTAQIRGELRTRLGQSLPEAISNSAN